MVVDLGTGDGRAALAVAEADPRTLVIAMDADAASMADASRRAARPAARGGLPNAVFVMAAAESPPVELASVADEVRILFPWGSLLRGVLGHDAGVVTGIAALLKPGGETTVLVSVARRDRLADLPDLDGDAIPAIGRRLADRGLMLIEARPAPLDEVRATRSTWGRRLAAGDAARTAWWLRLRAGPRRVRPADGRSGWAAV